MPTIIKNNFFKKCQPEVLGIHQQLQINMKNISVEKWAKHIDRRFRRKH